MGAIHATAPPATAARRFRFTMLLPTLLVNVAAPIGVFRGLEAAGVSPVWALATGCVPPVLGGLHAWQTRRRVDIVGLIMIGSIGGGVAATIISGNIGSRIITDCLLNAAWGLVFLGSLLLARPLLFYLIRSLVAGGDVSRAEAWDGLWRLPLFRRALRSMTATWALVYFAEILIELALAQGLTADTVLTIAPLMSTAATLGLIVFTHLGMTATRKRLERQEAMIWPL